MGLLLVVDFIFGFGQRHRVMLDWVVKSKTQAGVISYLFVARIELLGHHFVSLAQFEPLDLNQLFQPDW